MILKFRLKYEIFLQDHIFIYLLGSTVCQAYDVPGVRYDAATGGDSYSNLLVVYLEVHYFLVI